MKLILASQSPYRQEQLKNMGYEFTAQASQLDEEEFKKQIDDPYNLCAALAKGKALAVQKSLNNVEDTLIIGADQLLNFDGEILGKAGSPEKAVDQLLKLAGKDHELITCVSLLLGKQEWHHMDVSEVTLKNFNREQATAYVEKDQPWDCAGSYKIEKQGRELIDDIDSRDETAIVGLPTKWLGNQLAEILKLN